MRIVRSFPLALAVLALGASACGRLVAPKSPAPDPGLPSDDQLVAVAYGAPSVPEGVYWEDWAGAPPYYVNTVSVTPIDQRQMRWIELSTSSADEARGWALATEAYGSAHREIVAERSTAKYFEFLAQNPSLASDRVRLRAHRASYLDRSGYDLFHPGEVLGRFVVRPVTAAAAKELAEYLWQVANGSGAGTVVIASRGFETEGEETQVLTWVTLVTGDFGMRDTIVLGQTTYRVSRGTGEITRTDETLRAIPGRQR